MTQPRITIDGHDLNTLPGVRVLGNLSIQWGRSGRLSQPTPAAASISILIDDHAENVLDVCAPGKEISVTATNTNPARTHTVIDAHPNHSILKSGTYRHHPGIIQSLTGNPAAWDSTPRVSGNTRAHLTFTATLPPNTQLTARPYYYADPFANTRRPGDIITTISTSGTHSISFTPPRWANGTWIGLEFTYSNAGKTIDQEHTTIDTHPHTFDQLTADTLTRITLTLDHAQTSACIISGRITDAVLEYDAAHDRPRLNLTALDFSAELANIFVGSTPFLEENITTRLTRILSLTGKNVDAYAAPTLHNIPLARRDVDRQTALNLLEDTARSVGGTLWAISNTSGNFFHIEDPRNRPSLYVLLARNGTSVIAGAPWNGVELTAASIYRHGISVYRDTSDLATTVKVTWQRVTQKDDGTYQTEPVEVIAHDTQRTRTYGTRTLSYSTDLATHAAAHTLAHQLLEQTAPGSWHLPRARWNTHHNPDNIDLIPFLDSYQRAGLPITITNTESWVPGAPNIPVYLDGGRYEYNGKSWNLELFFTRAATPNAAVTIDEIPAELTIDTTQHSFNQLSTVTTI